MSAHADVVIEIDSEIPGNSDRLHRRGVVGIWCWWRADQSASVFSWFNCRRLAAIHNDTVSRQSDTQCSSSLVSEGQHTPKNLRVIRVCMRQNNVVFHKLQYICSVEYKKERSEDWTLGYSKQHQTAWRWSQTSGHIVYVHWGMMWSTWVQRHQHHRVAWSTLSNAADRSRSVRLPESSARRMSDNTLCTAVSVKRCAWNADCWSSSMSQADGRWVFPVT